MYATCYCCDMHAYHIPLHASYRYLVTRTYINIQMLFHINSFRQSVYRIPLDDGSSTGTHSGTGGGAEGAVGGGGDRQSTALALQGVFRQLQVYVAYMLCTSVSYMCVYYLLMVS